MVVRPHLAAVAAALATALAVSACGEHRAASAASAASAQRAGAHPVGSQPSAAAPASPYSREATACQAHIPSRLLPSWARTGFSDPRPHMPYVHGAQGAIAAIVWADPLVSPAAKDVSNKILWVSHSPFRPGGGSLRIRAQRLVGSKPVGRPVTREVIGGPGPSIIDLPAAGCWRLSLSWW